MTATYYIQTPLPKPHELSLLFWHWSIHIPLTSVCCVHSNIYHLDNIKCIRYLTVVYPILSTSHPLQKYHTLTSGSVKAPLHTNARNSSSIGEEPVPYHRSITIISTSATSNLVCQADQVITTFTNVLQDHNTVVLVCCTIEREVDITWTWGTQVQNLCHLDNMCTWSICTHQWQVYSFGMFIKLHIAFRY